MLHKLKRSLNVLTVVSTILLFTQAGSAQAAALQSLKDQISDSRPSTVANHTITLQLSASNTWASTETLVVDFVDGDGFDTSGFANSEPEDFDIKWNTTEKTMVASGSCAADSIEITTVNTTTDTFTFTLCSGSSASSAGETIEIQIGTNATAGSAGNDQIVNSGSTGSKQITVTAAGDDAKDTLVAMINGVTVSTTVEEALTVAVNAVTAGANCDDNGGSPTEITSTSTTIPFGTINTEAFYNSCQRIDVDTNAAGGYATTVRQTQLLTSGSNTVSEGTCDGTCSDTALGGWETATNNGFGYCADDRSGNAAADAGIVSADQCDDATPLYYTFFTAPTEPSVSFMASTGPISGDQTNISYHLSVPGDQAAGTYTNVMTYVSTPTF